jgi:CheY-like chemotaxis protein
MAQACVPVRVASSNGLCRSRSATICGSRSCLEQRGHQALRMIYNVFVAEPDNDIWTSIANGVRRHQPDAAIVRVKDGEQASRYLFERGLFTDEPETPHLIVLAAELPVVPANSLIDRLRQHPRTATISVIVIRRDVDASDSEQEALQPGTIQIAATHSLEKDVAYGMSQLHEASRPTAASARCNPQ